MPRQRYIVAPSSNRNWKRENCVLFSPRRNVVIVPLLNRQEQSVRFDTGINYSTRSFPLPACTLYPLDLHVTFCPREFRARFVFTP